MQRLAQAVRRDTHKMRAFVRFREVQEAGGTRYVSWFEPDHYIVEANAPFFVRRFATMVWSILTPYRSAHWTGAALEFGPGAQPGRRARRRPARGLLARLLQQHLQPGAAEDRRDDVGDAAQILAEPAGGGGDTGTDPHGAGPGGAHGGAARDLAAQARPQPARSRGRSGRAGGPSAARGGARPRPAAAATSGSRRPRSCSARARPTRA